MLKKSFQLLCSLLLLSSCIKGRVEEAKWYNIDEVVEVKFERGEEVKFHSPFRHVFSSGIVTDETIINLMGENIKAGDKLHLKGQSNYKGEIVRLIQIKKVETT